MNSRILSVFAVIVTLFSGMVVLTSTAVAQQQGEVPGQALGLKSDADLWRFVRTGNAGSVSMKNELGAVMIQSEGDNWRSFVMGLCRQSEDF